MADLELIRIRPRQQGMLDRLRSYWLGPWSTKDKALAQHLGGGPTLSGVPVNEISAMAYSAIWSGVMLIADDIASLPLNLYRRLPNGGKDKYEAHPLHRLIHDEPNPEMDAIVFRRTMQIHAELWQNAYAEIERDGAGRPVALWPLVPESVQPYRDRPTSPLRYRVYNPSGGTVDIPMSDMLHLVGYSHDGSVGSSLAIKARESIGLGLAAERFGAAFFGNGATVGGVVSFKGARPPEMSDKAYKEQFEARHQGLDRAFRLLALYNEAKYQQTSVNPNEGQFNETRIMQIREAARWLRIPPHKLGDLADATYSNVEQMDAAYFGSLRPRLGLWHQQLNRKLIARLERNIQFIEHDTHGFLSVDAQARGELYSSEFNIGAITPNDVRGYENRNPLDGGDEAFVPLNVTPLSRVVKWWDLQIEEKQAQIDKLKAPPEPPQPPPSQAARDHIDLLTARIAIHEKDAASLLEQIATLTQARDSDAQKVRALEQRVEDLSAARDASEQNGVTALRQVNEALEQERADRTKDRDAWTTEREALQTNIDQANARADAVEEAKADAESERDQARSERDSAREAVIAEQLARSQEQAAHDAAVAALDLQRLDAEDRAGQAEARWDVAQSDLTEARGQISRLTDDLTAVTSERDGSRAAAEASGQALAVAQADRDEAIAHRHAAQANESLHLQRAEQAERDKGIAEQTQHAANVALESVRAAHAEQLTRMLTATRGIVFDAMRRIIRKETEKAQRYQATPEKLRGWIRTFYVLHSETCFELLQPAIRAHLSILDRDDLTETTQTIVDEHIAESTRQLEAAASSEPSEFQIVLTKVLNRWETQRADALADRLLKEGVDHVRANR